MDNPLEAGSPPPPQLDQAPRQLPSLPIEILQRIIQLALPRLSFNTFPERYDVLLICCRVNKLWAALAQRELWRHAGFSTVTHLSRFYAARATYGQTNNRSLWLRRSGDQSCSVEDVLSSARAPVAFYHSSESLKIYVSLVKLSAAAPELQVLALDLFQLNGTSPSPVAFGHLRCLALSCPPKRTDLNTFLHTAELPLLDTFALAVSESLNVIEPEHLNLLGQALRRHAAKVKRFSFGVVDSSRPLCLPQDVWPTFTALEHLVLDCEARVSSILSSIPTRLVSFRLRSPFRSPFEEDDVPTWTGPWTELLETMRSRPQALESLSELILPSSASTELASADEEEIEEMSRERGIKISWRSPSMRGDYAAHLEDSLDF